MASGNKNLVKYFDIAGIAYHEDALMELADEDWEYQESKKQLIENGQTDEHIYKYSFLPKKVELVPEPDNPHDPSAIKVIADGIHVGYIKATECAAVKELLESGEVTDIQVSLEGGQYTRITEDDDGEYDVETGFDQFEGTVQIYTPNPDYDPTLDPALAPKKEETKAFGLSTADNHYTKRGRIITKILLGILALMSLVLAIVFPVMLVVAIGCIVAIIVWKEPKKS